MKNKKVKDLSKEELSQVAFKELSEQQEDVSNTVRLGIFLLGTVTIITAILSAIKVSTPAQTTAFMLFIAGWGCMQLFTYILLSEQARKLNALVELLKISNVIKE